MSLKTSIFKFSFLKPKPVHHLQKAYAKARVPVFSKRGSMLSGLVGNKKPSKHFCETINVNPTKKFGMFDKVSRPSRREIVLNNTFIEVITDCVSTGDVVPEIMGMGIEITGVNISRDYKTLNVYWEIPPSRAGESADVAAILAKRAPRIRVEIISRNIVGKVPHIFFVRDETNARIADFEKALALADMGPEELSTFVPDKDFVKDIYKFETARIAKNLRLGVAEKPNKQEIFRDPTVPPEKPPNMKVDILGLDHAELMNRVALMKKRDVFENQEVVRNSEDDDLFSKIPGDPLRPDADRSALLKTFCIERKKGMEEAKKADTDGGEEDEVSYKLFNTDYGNEDPHFEPDFFDEEELTANSSMEDVK